MRLSISQKRGIVSMLAKNLLGAKLDSAAAVEKMVQELADKKVPKQVMDVFNKYPELLDRRRTELIELAGNDNSTRYVCYKVTVRGDEDQYLLKEEDITEEIQLKNLAYLETVLDYEKLVVDTKLILSSINTHKQLKDRFPIGYAALYGSDRTDISESVLADSIAQRVKASKQ